MFSTEDWTWPIGARLQRDSALLAARGKILVKGKIESEKKMDETKTERIEEIGEIEENEEIQEKNAVSSLLQNFELPDITTNKKEKIPLSLDHR